RQGRDRRRAAALVALDADLEENAQLARAGGQRRQHDGIAVLIKLLEPRLEPRCLQARLALSWGNEHELQCPYRPARIDREAQAAGLLAIRHLGGLALAPPAHDRLGGRRPG